MRIAYFGFDLFYNCLEKIINENHTVIKIFTCDVDGDYEKNSRTFELADKLNIPITKEKVTKEMIDELEISNCDLIVSAGYYYKIPVNPNVLSVNIHPSPLPIGQGPWPQPWIILNKMKYSAVTIHKLSNDFDTGDIVLQKTFSVCETDNLVTLTDKSVSVAADLISLFLNNIDYYINNSKPQIDGAYWKEPTIDQMTFSLLDNYDKIDCITRAFYGYKCYCKLQNNLIKIKRAKCLKENGVNHVKDNETPLNVYDIDNGKLLVLE